MKLSNTFKEGIQHSEKLILLYDSLVTRSERGARSDWTERFFNAHLVKWPKKEGLWRSRNNTLLIIGKGDTTLSHRTFSSDSLTVLLRAALVLALAAVDKVLHEAVSRRFVELVKKGKLDHLVDLELSKSYQIAIATRIRRGTGGNIRSRPGPKIKAEVLDKTYRDSYLSPRKLQEICAACGKKKIFKEFGKNCRPQIGAKDLQDRWSRLYARRNQIAHECDIIRKKSARKVHFNRVIASEIRENIKFVKDFGVFLAKVLD